MWQPPSLQKAPPQRVLYCPTNRERMMGTVCFSWLGRKDRANISSPQEKRKEYIATAASPGRTKGRATRQKAWKRPHPSIRAASSKSRGTSWKKLLTNQTAMGVVNGR